jgi:quinol monooxygenase YgiN
MKPIIVINRLMIKPGNIEEFIRTQQTFVETLPPRGVIGGRMYRSVDEQSAVLVSVFESKGAADAVLQRAEFKEHLRRLQPLIESSSPSIYEEAYTYGTFP